MDHKTEAGSVTGWIAQLKAGDELAAQRLWENYFRLLVARARQRLAGTRRGLADEEDAALSAFDSFCRGAELGRFPQMRDRYDLWQMLVLITDRKAIDLANHERRLKRGGGLAPVSLDADSSRDGIFQAIAREPEPEFAAQVAEEFQRLLVKLGSDDLRQVALWKLEGYTIEEIAQKLGCVPRTVDRRLRLIRSIWGEDCLS